MRIYTFDRSVGHAVRRFGSQGFTLSPILRDVEAVYVACMYLGPGGVVGRHEAAGDQLLLVVEGGAVVTGADEKPVSVGPGRAAFWRKGEKHETRAGETGLVAIVVEGERLDPGCVMLLGV